MTLPTLSIVVVTRSRPDELRECLHYALRQTQPPIEIVIIDSSDDGRSRDEVVALARAAPVPLRYIHAESGIASQRARGIRESLGDIVFFLDDDVSLAPDCLFEIRRVFDTHVWEKIGGVTAHDTLSHRPSAFSLPQLAKWLCFLPCFGSGRFRRSGLHTTANGRRGILPVDYMGGAFTAYRRSVLLEIPPDELRFPGPFEDVDLSYRVSRRYQNYYSEFARCQHRPSPINRGSPTQRAADMAHYYDIYFEKNCPKGWRHRLANRLARRALANGVYAMTTKDILLALATAILGHHVIALVRRRHRMQQRV